MSELLRDLNDYKEQDLEKAANALFPVQRYLNILSLEGSSLENQVRKKRHKAWIESVLAIYFNSSSAEDICHYWSLKTLEIIEETWSACELDQYPLALFAFGKLGALELNLSSDVDLLIIAEDGADVPQKKIQLFNKTLTQSTEMSWAYRVDFDLRPGGRLGPLISTFDQFEDYYGNYGSIWERMAFVRFKNIAGSKGLVDQTLSFAKKFTYRRFTDYALFSEFKELRPKVHSSGAGDENTYNLKLQPGGIRDIEFIVQSWQVIQGGKHPSLQVSSIRDALHELAQLGILSKSEGDFLLQSYWQLRDLENRVQAIDDNQTHTVKMSENEFIFQNSSLSDLKKTIADVQALADRHFGPLENDADALPLDFDEQKVWLLNKGVSTQVVEDCWQKIHETKILSKSEKRDAKEQNAFLNQFLQEVFQLDLDIDLAIRTLTDFTKAVRAKASFYSLFNHEPSLIKEMAFLLSASPYLGQRLVHRPELIDSFFFRQLEEPSDDTEILLEQLSERKVVSELIGANDFLSQRNISLLLFVLSENTDNIVRSILKNLSKELDPENQMEILTMGKWAGFELGFRSDLDFVFLTEGEITENHHKLAKRLIRYLTSHQKSGKLFDIDMRLRPSGNSGPLITPRSTLNQFLSSTADVWVRQAYTKCRFLTKKDDLSTYVLSQDLTEEDLATLKGIRRKLFEQNKPKNRHHISLKYTPGGLVDVEFAVQIGVLTEKKRVKDVSTLGMLDALSWPIEEKRKISENYSFLREIEQYHQLTVHQSGSTMDPDSEGFLRICRILRMDKESLVGKLRAAMEDLHQIVTGLDPAYSKQ